MNFQNFLKTHPKRSTLINTYYILHIINTYYIIHIICTQYIHIIFITHSYFCIANKLNNALFWLLFFLILTCTNCSSFFPTLHARESTHRNVSHINVKLTPLLRSLFPSLVIRAKYLKRKYKEYICIYTYIYIQIQSYYCAAP